MFHLPRDILMIDIKTQQGLMAWLINYLADCFGNRAILKGGMELRLLNCPRFTNDVDFIFIPYSSKKEVAKEILEVLQKVSDLVVKHSLNSKCLRCICCYKEFQVQLEVNVAEECDSQELSTASFAKEHNQTGRIIRGMRFDIALSHKLAAWNERQLMRDLYDAYFMVEILNITPHKLTLESRLSKSEIRQKGKTKKVSMSLEDFRMKLKNASLTIDYKSVTEELRDFFPPEELPGLDMKLKMGINKIIEHLTNI